MAVAKIVCYAVVMFILTCCFTSNVLSVQLDGQFPNPSSNVLEISTLDGSSHEDLHTYFYHVHKRSAIVFHKKAIEIDKKEYTKTISKEILEHLSNIKNTSKNFSTAPTTIVVDISTSGSSSPEDKYNASTSTPSMPSVTPSSLADGSNTSSTTSASTNTSEKVSPTTAFVTTTMSKSTSAATKATPSVSDSTEDLPTMPPGLTNKTDHHVYYNSSVVLDEEKAMSYRVDFTKLPQDKVFTHPMLSDSHRRAATVQLSFAFPFYGHPVHNITIATGGFLYMGDYMHSWLAATQYVAPLMANFDTSLTSESTVRYFDNGTAFVIEWHNVSLQEHPDEKFTFQAILLKNGDIVFVYETIPVSVTEIRDELHPVKVGLSDAYVIDRVIYFIRRKTIYEYHRIDKKIVEISNHTAIYFTALHTCQSFQDCESCMNANISLECVWCEAAQRCSDGLDRNRQDWLQQRCDVERSKVNCSFKPSPNLGPFVQPLTDIPPKTFTTFTESSNDILQGPSSQPQQDTNFKPGPSATNFEDEISHSARVDERQGNFSIGGVVAVLLLVALALGTLAWVGYAYRNPHTSSGQLLIKYRPSQWRFRSGEARYTAASVHM